MRLLLAIPSYRDSARLRVFLPQLCESLAGIPGVAVQVVDDGSGEEEAAKLREIVKANAGGGIDVCAPIILERNLGKGGAIYAAWDSASPEFGWLGFADADGATPASEVARLVRMVLESNSGADVILGSRIQMMGRTVVRSLKRHLIGRIFATLSTLLTGLVVYDSQCGCKFLKASYYTKVRSFLVEMRYAFDIDLLVNLDRAGAALRECPIDWHDVPGSKVSVLRDGMQMLAALVRLRGRLARRKAESDQPWKRA